MELTQSVPLSLSLFSLNKSEPAHPLSRLASCFSRRRIFTNPFICGHNSVIFPCYDKGVPREVEHETETYLSLSFLSTISFLSYGASRLETAGMFRFPARRPPSPFTKHSHLRHEIYDSLRYHIIVPKEQQSKLQKSLFHFFLSLMKNLRCQARRFFVSDLRPGAIPKVFRF